MNPRILAALSFLAIVGFAGAARAEDPSPPRLYLGADGALALWMSPGDFAFEAAFGVGLRWRVFSLAAEFRGSPPSGAVRGPNGLDVTTERAAGAVAPCFHWNVMEGSREGGPYGCAVMQAGAVSPSAAYMPASREEVLIPYAAAGVRIGFEIGLAPSVSVRAGADFLGVILRPELRTEGPPLWTAPPFSMTVGGGLVLFFW